MSHEPTPAVPVGNTYDKYASSNPVERRLMAGFFAALDASLPRTSPQRILQCGWRRLDGLELRARVALAKAFQGGLEVLDPQHPVVADPDATLGTFGGRERGTGRARSRREQLACMVQQRLPRRSQRDLAPRAQKQLAPELILQVADLPAQCWLRQVQPLRCARKAEGFCNRHKIPQVP